MVRRRNRGKVKINTKLIWDVMAASLIVQKAPKLINNFVPLPPGDILTVAAGVGAGYVTGMLAKRPDLANGSLALGVVEVVSPMIDNLIGGFGGQEFIPDKIVNSKLGISRAERIALMKNPINVVEDFINLNDYTSNPGRTQAFDTYVNSY